MINPHSMIGKTIDEKYVIVDLIGEGGMGAVFKAKQIGLERFVAIKFLSGPSELSSRNLERLRREGRALALLSHKNIASFYGFNLSEQFGGYLVMELIEGSNLRNVLNEIKVLSPERAMKMVRQIALAMDYAHHSGVIHRDLKPENIQLIYDGDDESVKIMDFGLVKLIAPEFCDLQSLTITGSLIGTANYLDPEYIFAGKAGPQSDIYSLGCILYEVLTGELPYRQGVASDLTTTRIELLKAPSEMIGTSLPVGLDDIVLKAIAVRQTDRYQSMADFAHDLHLVMSGQGAGVTSFEMKKNTAGFVGSNGIVAFCLLISLAIGVCLLLQMNPRRKKLEYRVSANLKQHEKLFLECSKMRGQSADACIACSKKLLKMSKQSGRISYEVQALCLMSQAFRDKNMLEESTAQAEKAEALVKDPKSLKLIDRQDGLRFFASWIVIENFRLQKRYDEALRKISVLEALEKNGALQIGFEDQVRLLEVKRAVLRLNHQDQAALAVTNIEKDLFKNASVEQKFTMLGRVQPDMLSALTSAEREQMQSRILVDVRYAENSIDILVRSEAAINLAGVMDNKEAIAYLRKFSQAIKIDDVLMSNLKADLARRILSRSANPQLEPEWKLAHPVP